jgi:hypothetical protein
MKRADAAKVRSTVSGVVWPAVPDAKAASMLALLYQLDHSQWWPPEDLRAAQFGQLALLLAHAAANRFLLPRSAEGDWILIRSVR